MPKWAEFQRRYRAELDGRPGSWAPIVDAARAGDVVLLYSSHDAEHNNVVVLRDYVHDHHPGEPDILHHTGKALSRAES